MRTARRRAEIRSPMGIAVIGGLLSSLFLKLTVVPVAYAASENFIFSR